MQELGMNKWMSEKEIEKQIALALQQSSLSLEQNSLSVSTPSKVKQLSIEEALRDGGVTTYKYNGKKYSISVITQEVYEDFGKQEAYMEEGLEYSLPPAYKFHIKNAYGNYVTVRAKTYTEAQSVIDSLCGVGVYRVSASIL